MTPVSIRHLLPGALLVAVAAVCVAWLEVEPHQVDPCERPGELALVHQIPGARAPEPVDFGSPELILRARSTLDNPFSLGEPMRFQLVRSFDVLTMSGRPVSLVSQKIEAENHRLVERRVGDTLLPVHIVEDHTRSPSLLVAYFHVYGNRPVAYPLTEQLSQVPEVLRSGSPAISTWIISAATDRLSQRDVEAKALAWVDSAWSFHRQRCAPSI